MTVLSPRYLPLLPGGLDHGSDIDPDSDNDPDPDSDSDPDDH
jgi:hypothetical protein